MPKAENPRAVAGDNSSHRVAGDQLKQIVERIERMETEKKGVADDIREIYAEAKGDGYDTKTIRRIVALRRLDPEKAKEELALLDTYCDALGMGAFA